MVLFLACETGPTAEPAHPEAGGFVGDSVEDTSESGADPALPPSFERTTEVLVVGSGPAGVAAALTAVEAGREVLMLEKSATPGTGIRLGGVVYAAMTRWQEAQGFTDTLDAAQADWLSATGVEGTRPSVTAFIQGSGPTLAWLADAHGVDIRAPSVSAGEGELPRTHRIAWSASAVPFEFLTDGQPITVETEVEVTGPVMWQGAVVGVRWRNTSGEEGSIGADAVVLATGGFLRDLAQVEAHAPALAGLEPLFETNPTSNGGGLPFLAEVDAAWETPGNIGAYVHSVQDPWRPAGEALIVSTAVPYIIVGADGRRFALEHDLGSFLVAPSVPDRGAWLITAYGDPETPVFQPPGYNWADAMVAEHFTPLEVMGAGSEEVFAGNDAAEVILWAGLPVDALDELENYNNLAASGAPEPFGGILTPDKSVDGIRWMVVRLHPGLAKNFGGVATDLDGRVLDLSGAPVAGLFAAGEVTGMLPGGGAGRGFAGSVGACYYGGRVAGATAAAYVPEGGP